METKMVEPGTPLAASEEMLPGPGTYDDGDQIRAAIYGKEAVDPDTFEVRVVPAGRTVATIEPGDVVVGLVTYAKPELASVRILEVRGKAGRSLLQQVEGTLHVSKVDKRYVKDIGDELRAGDLIRARVLSLKGGPQLATDAPDLGVVSAPSPDDLTRRLESKGDHLVDPVSGRTYRRKLAKDYGSGTV